MRLIPIFFILIYSGNPCHAQDLKVIFPEGTTLQSPWIVNFYSDTINGKIVFNNWPSEVDLIANTTNYSNGKFPCGSTENYSGTNWFYLKDIYSPWNNSVCYASGPIPDTIGVEIRKSTGEVLDSIYFVIMGKDPPTEPAEPDLRIYPNPTLNFITIDSKESMISAELMDAIGRKLISISPVNLTESLSLETYGAGCYFLRLQTTTGNYSVHKIVKIKE